MMKRRMTDKKTLKAVLALGLALMAAGAGAAYLIPEQQHLASRLSGFVSGLGSALALTGGVLLLRRARLGEERARDSVLNLTDERGVAVAYRAQSAAAICAMLALAVISLAALVRGDVFYLVLGTAACIFVALVKLIAWYIYDKKM